MPTRTGNVPNWATDIDRLHDLAAASFNPGDIEVLDEDADPVGDADIDDAAVLLVARTTRANLGDWVQIRGELLAAVQRAKSNPRWRDWWPLAGCDARISTADGVEFLRRPVGTPDEVLDLIDRLTTKENP